MTAVSEALARVAIGQARPGDRELLAEHGGAMLPVSETTPPQQISRVASDWSHDFRHDQRFIDADREYTRTRSQEARDAMAAVASEYAQAARERAERGPSSGLIPSQTLPQPASMPVPDDMRAQPYQRPPTQTTLVHRNWEDMHQGDQALIDELAGRNGLRGQRPAPPISAAAGQAARRHVPQQPPPSLSRTEPLDGLPPIPAGGPSYGS